MADEQTTVGPVPEYPKAGDPDWFVKQDIWKAYAAKQMADTGWTGPNYPLSGAPIVPKQGSPGYEEQWPQWGKAWEAYQQAKTPKPTQPAVSLEQVPFELAPSIPSKAAPLEQITGPVEPAPKPDPFADLKVPGPGATAEDWQNYTKAYAAIKATLGDVKWDPITGKWAPKGTNPVPEAAAEPSGAKKAPYIPQSEYTRQVLPHATTYPTRETPYINWFNSLTDEEQHSLRSWTYGAYAIRQAQANENNPTWKDTRVAANPYYDEDYWQEIDKRKPAFESAMAKSPVWDGTVYRGMHGLDQANVDKWKNLTGVFQNAASSSASILPEGAEHFSHKYGGYTGTGNQTLIMEINGQHQTINPYQISGMPGLHTEREVILPKGARYNVDSFEENKHGLYQHHVRLSQIPEDEDIGHRQVFKFVDSGLKSLAFLDPVYDVVVGLASVPQMLHDYFGWFPKSASPLEPRPEQRLLETLPLHGRPPVKPGTAEEFQEGGLVQAPDEGYPPGQAPLVVPGQKQAQPSYDPSLLDGAARALKAIQQDPMAKIQDSIDKQYRDEQNWILWNPVNFAQNLLGTAGEMAPRAVTGVGKVLGFPVKYQDQTIPQLVDGIGSAQEEYNRLQNWMEKDKSDYTRDTLLPNMVDLQRDIQAMRRELNARSGYPQEAPKPAWGEVSPFYKQSAPGQVSGAIGAGLGLAGIAALTGGTGAAAAFIGTNAEDQYNRIRESGGSAEEATQAARFSVVPSIGQYLILGAVGKGLTRAMTVGQVAKNVLKEAAVGGFTGTAGDVANNLYAHLSGIDPNRKWDDQVAQDALQWTVLGGGLRFLHDAPSVYMKSLTTPDTDHYKPGPAPPPGTPLPAKGPPNPNAPNTVSDIPAGEAGRVHEAEAAVAGLAPTETPEERVTRLNREAAEAAILTPEEQAARVTAVPEARAGPPPVESLVGSQRAVYQELARRGMDPQEAYQRARYATADNYVDALQQALGMPTAPLEPSLRVDIGQQPAAAAPAPAGRREVLGALKQLQQRLGPRFNFVLANASNMPSRYVADMAKVGLNPNTYKAFYDRATDSFWINPDNIENTNELADAIISKAIPNSLRQYGRILPVYSWKERADNPDVARLLMRDPNADTTTGGLYGPVSRTAFINVSKHLANPDPVATALKTAVHEVGFHGGIRQLFGADYLAYDNFLGRLYDYMKDSGTGDHIASQFQTNMDGLAKAYGFGTLDEGKNLILNPAEKGRLAEELLARYAERFSPYRLDRLPNILQRMIQFVQDGLERYQGLTMTKGDLFDIIQDAWKSGEPERDPRSAAALGIKRILNGREDPDSTLRRRTDPETIRLEGWANNASQHGLVPAAGSDQTSNEQIKASSDRLGLAAQREGVQYDPERLIAATPVAITGSRGAEHDLYSDLAGRIWKVTRGDSETGPYGASPSGARAHARSEKAGAVAPVPGADIRYDAGRATAGQYLDSLRLANEIFGAGNRFEGTIPDPASGTNRVITSQPVVGDEYRSASVGEIAQYMAARGFDPIDDRTYYNPSSGVVVIDAHPGTIVRNGETGEIRSLDAKPFQVDQELGRELEQKLFRDYDWKAMTEDPANLAHQMKIHGIDIEGTRAALAGDQETFARMERQYAADDARIRELRTKSESDEGLTPGERRELDDLEMGPLLQRDVEREVGPGSGDLPARELLKRAIISARAADPPSEYERVHAKRTALDPKEAEAVRAFNNAPDQLLAEKGSRPEWERTYNTLLQSMNGNVDRVINALLRGEFSAIGDRNMDPVIYKYTRLDVMNRRAAALSRQDQALISGLDTIRQDMDAYMNQRRTAWGQYGNMLQDVYYGKTGILDDFEQGYNGTIRQRVRKDSAYNDAVNTVQGETQKMLDEALSDASVKKVLDAAQGASDAQTQAGAEKGNVEQIVRDTYTGGEKSVKSVSEKLTEGTALNADQSKIVQDAVGKITRSAAVDKTKDQIDKILASVNNGAATDAAKALARARLLDMIATGTFSRDGVADALGVLFGFDKTYLPEIIKQLQPLADQLEKYKQEGRLGWQTEAVRLKLLRSLARYQEFGFGRYWINMLQGNLLSGIPGHVVAFMNEMLQGTANTAAMLGYVAQRDPLRLPQAAVGSMGQIVLGVWRSLPEAVQTLRTGVVPPRFRALETLGERRMEPWEQPNLFESAPTERWLADTIPGIGPGMGMTIGRGIDMFGTGVFRGTSALHSIISGTFGRATENMLAMRYYHDNLGLSMPQAIDAAYKMMYDAGGRMEAFKQQATKEGLSGLDHAIRVNELIEQQMPQPIRTEAQYWATEANNFQRPYGMLGSFEATIQNLTRDNPFYKQFFPFIRIPANLINTAVDFSPFGLARALIEPWADKYLAGGERRLVKDESIWEREFGKNEISRERYDELRGQMLARGVAGTAALFGLAAAQQVFGNVFQIHGAGPANQDMQRQLMDSGWRPYSIQIGNNYFPYEYWPTWMVMQAVGNFYDRYRYEKFEAKEGQGPMTPGAALMASLTHGVMSIFDRTFLMSIGNLFRTYDEAVRYPTHAQEYWTNYATDQASHFVPLAGSILSKQLWQQLVDDRVYQQHGWGGLARSMPFTAGLTHPLSKVNALGEEIMPGGEIGDIRTPILNRLWTGGIHDQVWDFLNDRQILLTDPRDAKTLDNKTMTPEQLRDFVIFRGQALREQLTNRLDFLRGIEDRDQLKKVIDAIEGGVNRQAKARLYEGETAVPDRPR